MIVASDLCANAMVSTVEHHIKAIRPALHVMAGLGFSAEQCLQGTGLQLGDLEKPETRLSREQEWQFHRQLLALSNNPQLGLTLGGAYRMESYGVLGYAMLSAATLGEAVRLASDFDLLTFTHFRVSLLLEAQDACLRLLPQDDIPNDLRTLYEDRELAAVIAGGEQALGLRLQPSQISMMHGAQNTAHYEAFFQCPVQFSQAHAEFRFDAALLDLPMPLRDSETSRFCRQQCEQLLARLNASSDFVAQVRHMLVSQPRAFAKVEALADQLQLSPRSLRRRLHQEGTSYQQLLNEIRYQLALEYLSTRMRLEQIADLLGYTEASNFSHAFKRWHGCAPQEYRQSLAGKSRGASSP